MKSVETMEPRVFGMINSGLVGHWLYRRSCTPGSGSTDPSMGYCGNFSAVQLGFSNPGMLCEERISLQRQQRQKLLAKRKPHQRCPGANACRHWHRMESSRTSRHKIRSKQLRPSNVGLSSRTPPPTAREREKHILWRRRQTNMWAIRIQRRRAS